MEKTIAVIGAGRMGSVVATQLPPKNPKTIIDINLDKAKITAQKTGSAYDTSLQGAKNADIVFLVLSADLIQNTVNKLLSIVKKGAVLVNLATNASTDKLHSTHAFLIDAKIIGNAQAISTNQKAIMVVDRCDEKIFNTIKNLMSGAFIVEHGDIEKIRELNTFAVAESIKAAVTVKKKIKEMNCPEKWTNTVLEQLCITTMRAYINGNLGPFAQEIADKAEKDIGPDQA